MAIPNFTLFLEEYGTPIRPNTQILGISDTFRLKPHQKLLDLIGEDLATFRYGVFIIDIKNFLQQEEGSFYRFKKEQKYYYQPPNYNGWDFGIEFDLESNTYVLGKRYFTVSELDEFIKRWGKRPPLYVLEVLGK